MSRKKIGQQHCQASDVYQRSIHCQSLPRRIPGPYLCRRWLHLLLRCFDAPKGTRETERRTHVSQLRRGETPALLRRMHAAAAAVRCGRIAGPYTQVLSSRTYKGADMVPGSCVRCDAGRNVRHVQTHGKQRKLAKSAWQSATSWWERNGTRTSSTPEDPGRSGRKFCRGGNASRDFNPRAVTRNWMMGKNATSENVHGTGGAVEPLRAADCVRLAPTVTKALYMFLSTPYLYGRHGLGMFRADYNEASLAKSFVSNAGTSVETAASDTKCQIYAPCRGPPAPSREALRLVESCESCGPCTPRERPCAKVRGSDDAGTSQEAPTCPSLLSLAL